MKKQPGEHGQPEQEQAAAAADEQQLEVRSNRLKTSGKSALA
jgi:hypothetical protein